MTKNKPVEKEPEDGGFETLGLSPKLLSTLEKLKFHTPTDIQRLSLIHI